MPCLPYFPLYPKDILTDFRMNELKAEERGLFITFFLHLWVTENQIKDDDKRISRILSIPEKRWKILKCQLIESGLLTLTADGFLQNNRLSKEMEKSAEKCESALKGANARWGKEKSLSKKSKNAEEYDGITRDIYGKPIIKIKEEDESTFW